MPRTLRQHLQEAMDYMRHTHGYRTILPTKEPPAPVRIDERNRRLVQAVSVIRVVEKYDRTGYALAYLEASEDVSGEEWRRIPDVLVCPRCMERAQEARGKGPVFCRTCGDFTRPKNLRGLVSADLRAMRVKLRGGEIPVEKEVGERE